MVGKGGHLFSGLQLALHVPSGQWGPREGIRIFDKFAVLDRVNKRDSKVA